MLMDRRYQELQGRLSMLIKTDPLRSAQYERGILSAKSIVSKVHKYSGQNLQDEGELKEMEDRLRKKLYKPVPYDLPQRTRHADRYTNALEDALPVVKNFR